MVALTLQELAQRTLAALVCGAVVGLERERKHHPVGFRTMILISLGSCGFVLVGRESIAQIGLEAAKTLQPGAPIPGQAEISRVFQGLIGGIGFLGAAAVIQNKKAVRGITTAAAVWVVAALGAACAMGLFSLAIMLALLTLFTLIVLEGVEHRYFAEPDEPNGQERRGGENRGPQGDTGNAAASLKGNSEPRAGPERSSALKPDA